MIRIVATVGGISLAIIWWPVLFVINVTRHLVGRNKQCDKRPAERRPRRAF